MWKTHHPAVLNSHPMAQINSDLSERNFIFEHHFYLPTCFTQSSDMGNFACRPKRMILRCNIFLPRQLTFTSLINNRVNTSRCIQIRTRSHYIRSHRIHNHYRKKRNSFGHNQHRHHNRHKSNHTLLTKKLNQLKSLNR